jgi:hypothetical protein
VGFGSVLVIGFGHSSLIVSGDGLTLSSLNSAAIDGEPSGRYFAFGLPGGNLC